nr:hypothetical protein [Tanacetum cinerariifolium]
MKRNNGGIKPWRELMKIYYLGTIAQSGTSKFLNALKVDCRDRWRWAFQENGDFMVNVLTKLVEEKTLNVASEDEATIWNKWVPKRSSFSCGERFKSRLICDVCLEVCNLSTTQTAPLVMLCSSPLKASGSVVLRI